jgi:ABC-type glycerol-3-phosphate transport system substrate-binding protein
MEEDRVTEQRTWRHTRGNGAAALAVAAIIFAACGGNPASAAPPAGSAPASVAPTTATVPSAAADPNAPVGSFAGQELVLSRWAGDPWTAGQRAAADEWQTATGGKITFDAIPYENLRDKQALTLAAGGDYDMVYVHPSWFGQFASSGFLAPIGDYLADPSKNAPGFSAASYLPGILAQGTYQDKQYCVQDFISTTLLAYRKDLLEAAGIQPPKTLDDIVAAAKALDGKDGISGITLPGKRAGAVADIVSSLITAQGNWWYGADGKTTLDLAAATKAVDFYTKVAAYTPEGLLNFHVDEASTAAAQGQAAMIISTTPSLQALEDSTKSSTVGKWGYAPLAVTADKPAGELIYWNWCISAKSEHPEAAYSFLSWFTSAKQQAKIAVQTATAGATKDFYENQDVLSKLPFLTAMNQALTTSNPQPSLAEWGKAQDGIELAVQDAISGKQTPAQAADAMHAALVSALGG